MKFRGQPFDALPYVGGTLKDIKPKNHNEMFLRSYPLKRKRSVLNNHFKK